MRRHLNLIIILAVLLAIGLACEATTANLSDVSFAKDQEGNSKVENAKQGDKIYVLSSVNNAGGKYKVRWEAFRESGESIDIPQNEIEVDGSRAIWFTLSIPPNFPNGKYKFKVTLLNETGDKEIDNKSGTINISGGGVIPNETSNDVENLDETIDDDIE